MIDQNFGHKELYEVVLRAKNPMYFGDRYIEAQEPVLYFNSVNMSLLTEQNRPVFARGGWANMPRVIWDERSEVQFQMIDGVMSQVGMSILLSSNVVAKESNKPLYINKREGPFTMTNGCIDLQHRPIDSNIKKTFIFDYERDTIQEKIYGKLVDGIVDGFQNPVNRIQLYKDKNLTIPAENNRKYVVDYYYEYEE